MRSCTVLCDESAPRGIAFGRVAVGVIFVSCIHRDRTAKCWRAGALGVSRVGIADSVLRRASNLFRGLLPAPPGLDYAATQLPCSSYHIGYKHRPYPAATRFSHWHARLCPYCGRNTRISEALMSSAIAESRSGCVQVRSGHLEGCSAAGEGHRQQSTHRPASQSSPW